MLKRFAIAALWMLLATWVWSYAESFVPPLHWMRFPMFFSWLIVGVFGGAGIAMTGVSEGLKR